MHRGQMPGSLLIKYVLLDRAGVELSKLKFSSIIHRKNDFRRGDRVAQCDGVE